MSKIVNQDYKFEDFEDITKLEEFVNGKLKDCKKAKYNKGFVASTDTENFVVIKIAISKSTETEVEE